MKKNYSHVLWESCAELQSDDFCFFLSKHTEYLLCARNSVREAEYEDGGGILQLCMVL